MKIPHHRARERVLRFRLPAGEMVTQWRSTNQSLVEEFMSAYITLIGGLSIGRLVTSTR